MAEKQGCCPVGSEPALADAHMDRGTVITLGEDLPVYVTGSPDAKAAVIVTYDIYGFEGQSRIRLICDQLADLGLYVALPDYYRGDKWTEARMKAEGREGLFPWIKGWKWAGALEEDFKLTLAHVQSQSNVEKVGTVGFCFGGWTGLLSSSNANISAVYSAHPSTRIETMHGGDEVALANAAQCPVMFDTAGDDPENLKEGGAVFQALQARPAPLGPSMVTRNFPEVNHGFVTRGDLSKPEVAAAVKTAVAGMHAFLSQHLLGVQPAPAVITLGASKVSFSHVAREWRCKYALDSNGGPQDSASLAAAEAAFQEILPSLQALPGSAVYRVVCGGCGDFKVVVNQPAADHGAWGSKHFAPEQDFLAKLESIDGISVVEEQEYTMQEIFAAPDAISSDNEVVTLGASGVSFAYVAREWRCKYALDEEGGPHNSTSLAAAEELLQSYLPTLKKLPKVRIIREVCGGCGDFKVVCVQPTKDHGEWSANSFAPEAEFLEKLGSIPGVTQVEEQEYTFQRIA